MAQGLLAERASHTAGADGAAAAVTSSLPPSSSAASTTSDMEMVAAAAGGEDTRASASASASAAVHERPSKKHKSDARKEVSLTALSQQTANCVQQHSNSVCWVDC